VRVDPVDLRQHTDEFDRLVDVEFSGEGVMRLRGEHCQHQRGGGRECQFFSLTPPPVSDGAGRISRGPDPRMTID
jgi:hypothetical protein